MLRAVVGRVLLVLLAGYRILVSSWMPPRCRFAPSCSAYATEAIRLHGAWVGSRLAVVRVARCHPWHPGGYDPVPEHPGERPGRSSNHSSDHPA